MSQFILSFSPTGGTFKCAEALARGMKGEWKVVDLTEPLTMVYLESSAKELPYERSTDEKVAGEETAQECFAQGDVVLAAVPAFGGRVPDIAVQRLQKMNGNGAKAVLLCVYGNRAYEDTLLELQDVMTDAGFVCMAAVAAIAEHSIARQFAAGRPDAQDVEELAAFGKKICQMLQAQSESSPGGNSPEGISPDGTSPDAASSDEASPEGVSSDGTPSVLTLPGNRPYKQYGGSAMKPKADGTCVSCGLCAAKCPVQAIDPANPGDTDAQKCISCMKCIAVCPLKARKLDPCLLEAVEQRLKKACESRKENELFV